MTAPTVESAKSLNSKVARGEWERLFNLSYIEPVIEKLDEKMKEAMNLVAEDDKQGICLTLIQ